MLLEVVENENKSRKKAEPVYQYEWLMRREGGRRTFLRLEGSFSCEADFFHVVCDEGMGCFL